MRFGTFTRAAAELSITQSAVSRQISQLEAFLGRSLFTREKGTVKATMAGEQYARQVTGLLNGVSDATSDVMKYSGETEITHDHAHDESIRSCGIVEDIALDSRVAIMSAHGRHSAPFQRGPAPRHGSPKSACILPNFLTGTATLPSARASSRSAQA